MLKQIRHFIVYLYDGDHICRGFTNLSLLDLITGNFGFCLTCSCSVPSELVFESAFDVCSFVS